MTADCTLNVSRGHVLSYLGLADFAVKHAHPVDQTLVNIFLTPHSAPAYFLATLHALTMGVVLQFCVLQVGTSFALLSPESLDLCHSELERGHDEAFDDPIVRDTLLLT